jgi:glycosyltransferase involved in cell wall biosynthesis
MFSPTLGTPPCENPHVGSQAIVVAKINLLMLNYEFPPIGGGAANAHLCLLKQYADNTDLRVDVLTSAHELGFFQEKFSESITIFRVGVHKKNLHFWRKIEVLEWLAKAQLHYRKLLRENDYDLVHAFFGFPAGWLCYRSAKKLPYIISLRGSDVPGEHARLKLYYKILGPAVFKPIWRNAAALVACSEGLKKRALSFLPSVTIDVIPNGVELDRFHPPGSANNRNETSGRPLPLKLLTVGRLSVTKRVEMLIDAAQILQQDGHNVRLTIVGGGAFEQRLEQLVSHRNLSDVVEITGRVDSERMPQVYRQNDVFVSASMQEGMSNAMLEAMASGLPIVTTRCEGVEELIADNGIVTDEAQPGQIADAIKKLAGDANAHKKTAIAARKRAEKYSWKSVADRYLTHYRNIL